MSQESPYRPRPGDEIVEPLFTALQDGSEPVSEAAEGRSIPRWSIWIALGTGLVAAAVRIV